ncbi:MAG: hypothetical protein U5N58_07165 [Actinomycetota bacterium]|nr:hypothetical protein [Actinomycetota bacterium]
MGNGKNACERNKLPNKLKPLNDYFPEIFDQMVPELVEYSTMGRQYNGCTISTQQSDNVL